MSSGFYLFMLKKKWVVCEGLQVLKFPLIVLRIAFIKAGMEFNVRKTLYKTHSKILFSREESIIPEAEQ